MFDEVSEAVSKIADEIRKIVNQIITFQKLLCKSMHIEDKKLRKIRHLALHGKNHRIRKKNATRLYLLVTKKMEENE